MKNTLRFPIVTLSFLVLPLIATAQNGTPEAGKLDTLTAIDTSNNDADKVYDYLEKMPEFPGGVQALYAFINANIKYPGKARRKNIEGVVYAKFIVREDGFVTDVIILRDIGGGCGKEVRRVLLKSPRWTPGLQYGKPAAVFYNLPVSFTLSD